MLDCELYKKYYPIENDNEKKKFLEEVGSEKIRRLCQKKEYILAANILLKERDYYRKMKNVTPKSFFFEMKTAHNRMILIEMERDLELKKMRSQLGKAEILTDKIFQGDELSVKDINWILWSENQRHHKHLLVGFMVVLILIAVAALL